MLQLFVGEIGIPRHEFLHEMKFWELRSVMRGYNMRHASMWSAVRWQTYHLMQVSLADLKAAGIHRPTDLITFPWEQEPPPVMTDDEVMQMQREMDAENAMLAAAAGQGKP